MGPADNSRFYQGNHGGVWQPLKLDFPHPVPGNVRPWIRLQTSMTKQLKDCFGPTVAVRVLRNGTGHLHHDEQNFFSPRQARGFVREVVLHAEGIKLLAARTVFTSSKLCADEKIIHIGNKPLGELLFAKGNPEWLVREYTQVTPAVSVFSLVQRVVSDLFPHCWARRTLFLLDQAPLLVTEIFLPAMIADTAPSLIHSVTEAINPLLEPSCLQKANNF